MSCSTNAKKKLGSSLVSRVTTVGIAMGAMLIIVTSSGCRNGSSADNKIDASRVPEEGAAVLMVSQAPADTQCVQITAEGNRTVIRVFPVTPGQSTATLSMSGLPVGDVTFTGAAFSANCGAVSQSVEPEWVAEPVAVVVVSSPAVTVPLVFRRNGQATVNADF